MHYLHTHWPCVLQQPHQKHITIRQLKHTTTNKLHYNINHCYLWFAVSKRKHSAEQNHPRGGDFPSKKKKKFPAVVPFLLFFNFNYGICMVFFLTIESCWLIKKIKKMSLSLFGFMCFYTLDFMCFLGTSETCVRMIFIRDHLLEVFGAVRSSPCHLAYAA